MRCGGIFGGRSTQGMSLVSHCCVDLELYLTTCPAERTVPALVMYEYVESDLQMSARVGMSSCRDMFMAPWSDCALSCVDVGGIRSPPEASL